MLDCWFEIGVDSEVDTKSEVYGDTQVDVRDCRYNVDVGPAGINIRLLTWQWSCFWSWCW